MKILSLFILLTLGISLTYAQSLSRSVISSTGSSNDQLSYTVGEMVITTASNSSIVLTQGFMQPDRLFPDFIDPLGQETTFRVFPNPVKEFLTLELNTEKSFTILVSFVDIRGRKVLDERKLIIQEDTRAEFDVSTLANGHYVMILALEGHKANRSIRFQKIEQ